MAFALLYHRDVKPHDVPAISRDLQARIARAIRQRLTTAPEQYGHPLRGTLKGYWKLRVGDYRIVFKVSGNEVWLLGIGHRKEVYTRLLSRL